jgi:predicted nucleic-acid-binding protein
MNSLALDTNIVLRCLVDDEPRQTAAARALAREADALFVSLPALCEVVWVLVRGYKLPRTSIADALEFFLDSDKIHTDRAAVHAGLAILRAGGDFADGVIAYDGLRENASAFATFDKKAATLLTEYGLKIHLLAV